ncbi:response regulator transcription factor [Desulfothermus okinawensis JCM 13304]
MDKKKILIIEDEEDIQEILKFNIERAGFITSVCSTGEKALCILEKDRFDLIVLDLMLPDMDGLDILKKIKLNPLTKDTGVIILTARGEELDRILGFELGAEDYVVKPFSVRELILRIKAVLKRTQNSTSKTKWQYKSLVIDQEKMEVTIDGQEIGLTTTEFKLLLELIRADGKVLSREYLLNSVWGYDFEGYERTVDTHIRRLRAKLGPYSQLIKTIRGVGYKIKN